MSIPVNSVPTELSASVVDGVLRQTKARLIRVTLSVAACLWLAGTILFALGFAVADHLIDGGVPTWARFVLLALYLAAVFAGAAVLIVLACARRVGDAYTARLLERNHEGFHNSLINAVQLRRREDLPGSLVAALLARAAFDAGRCDVGRAVTLRRAAMAGAAAAVATLLLLGYAAVAPKSVLQSMLRAFGAPLPAPTRTFIVHMTPGDGASVLIGRAVTFSACLGGRNPREVMIDFSADGGVTILSGQRLGLVPIGPSDTVRQQHVWEGTKAGQDIQQTMHWRATAGDAVSGWRRLVVRPAPDVTELRVRCEYPAYTGMEPTTIEPGRPADIDAVVGTQVTIEAVTNVPIRDPVLVVTTGAGPENETRLPMQVIDEEKRRAGGAFTVIEDGRYCLRFFDLFGEPNADPIHHAIRARPDNPPAITVARPAGDLELDADASLSLDARVEDDFGITRLAMEYKRRGQGGSLSVPVEPPEGRSAARSCDVRIAIPLSRFTARAGDTIEWQLVAWDNRTGAHGQSAAQEGRGPLRRILVRESQQFAQAEPPTEDDQGSAKSDPADRPGNDAADNPATSQPTERNEDGQAGQQLARAEARDAGELDRFIEQHRDELARLREQLAEAKGDAKSEGSEPERKGASDAPKAEPGRAGPDPKNEPQNTSNAAQTDPGRAGPDSKNEPKDASDALKAEPDRVGPNSENKPKNAANAPNDASRDAGTAAKGAKPKDADDDTPTSEAPASSEDAKSSDTPGRPEGPERQRQQTAASDANIDQPNPQQADATGAFENPGAGDGTGSGRTTDAQGESGRGPGLQQGSAGGTPGTGQHAGRDGHGPGRSAEGSRGRGESGAGTETGDGASPGEAQGTGPRQSDRPGDEQGSQQAQGGGRGQSSGQSAERSGGGSGSAPGTETGEEGSPGRPQGDAPGQSGRSGSGERGQQVGTDGARDVGQQTEGEDQGQGAQPSSEGSGGKSGVAPGQEDGGEGSSNGPSGNNAGEPGHSGKRNGQRHSDDGTDEMSRQAESSGRGQGLKPSPGESRGGAEGTRSGQSDQSVSGEANSDSEGAGKGQGSDKGTSAGRGEQGKGQTGESGSAGPPGSAGTTAADGKDDDPGDAGSNAGKPSNRPGGTGTTPGGGGSGGPMAPDGSTDDTPPTTQPEQPTPPAAGPQPSTTGDVLPVIDALEERLRNKELDPKLLERLGWDEQRAAEFIREFRRAERRQEASERSAPPSSSFQTSTRPTVEVRRSQGTGAGVAPLSARNLRTPDSTGRLFESGRQRISEEYRDLLSAYYETLARERPTATRPVK